MKFIKIPFNLHAQLKCPYFWTLMPYYAKVYRKNCINICEKIQNIWKSFISNRTKIWSKFLLDFKQKCTTRLWANFSETCAHFLDLFTLSRPSTLSPRVTNKLRNHWRDQGNITTSVIISTQDTIRSNKK